MIIKKTVIHLLLILSLPTCIFAETVILKSGERVESKILERTGDYIKVEFEGMPLTYFLDDIESIDGQKIESPSKEAVIRENVGYVEEIEENVPGQGENGEIYFNEKYNFSVHKPLNWHIVDETHNSHFFNSQRASGRDYLCAFYAGEPASNASPMIYIYINFINDNALGLSLEEKAKAFYGAMKSNYDSIHAPIKIVEIPHVVTFGQKKCIRYTQVLNAQPPRFYNMVCQYVIGNKVYVISAHSYFDESERYRGIFEDVCESFEISPPVLND